MSRSPYARHYSFPNTFVRVNGKIRAREVRIITTDGSQLGVLPLNEALSMARSQGVDLVEVAPNAVPPVCRLVDYGKYRYELSKKVKETKRHQHANRVKEVQLSATIDPHDFAVKLGHAIDFLCEEMKIKITLRFRGREMAHQEFGFEVVNRLIKELAPYAHPDAPPRLVGRGLNVMLSPLPRNRRAKNPRGPQPDLVAEDELAEEQSSVESESQSFQSDASSPSETKPVEQVSPNGFANNPFSQLDVKLAGRNE